MYYAFPSDCPIQTRTAFARNQEINTQQAKERERGVLYALEVLDNVGNDIFISAHCTRAENANSSSIISRSLNQTAIDRLEANVFLHVCAARNLLTLFRSGRRETIGSRVSERWK